MSLEYMFYLDHLFIACETGYSH